MTDLSVVTISYNQAPYLARALESVHSQTSNLIVQHIVVDPGSSDDSRSIIDRYGSRVTRVYERDKGPADGLNRGFSVATGKWYAFLNADDEFLPGAFAHFENYIDQYPGTDVHLASGILCDAAGRPIRRIRSSRFTPQRYVRGAVTVFQQGMLFARRIFHEVGGFNPGNRISWDGELLLKMALAGARLQNHPEEVAAFRQQPDSLTVTNRLQEQYVLEKLRYFQLVYGRERAPRDRWLDMAYLTRKRLTPSVAIGGLNNLLRPPSKHSDG